MAKKATKKAAAKKVVAKKKKAPAKKAAPVVAPVAVPQTLFTEPTTDSNPTA